MHHTHKWYCAITVVNGVPIWYAPKDNNVTSLFYNACVFCDPTIINRAQYAYPQHTWQIEEVFVYYPTGSNNLNN